jgi:hypothetical protein
MPGTVQGGPRTSALVELVDLAPTLLAANRVSPRAAQALMRHSDPRLTASVYTDEKLLPLAAELVNVPSIPQTGDEDGGRAAPLTAAAR